MFEHPIFKSAPALAALKDTQMPHACHIRSCLLELTKIITKSTVTKKFTAEQIQAILNEYAYKHDNFTKLAEFIADRIN